MTPPLKELMLFGSREMAQRPKTKTFDPGESIGSLITDSTDWNWSGRWSQTTQSLLQSNGFTVVESNYKDDLTVCILRREQVRMCKEKIDVVLHSDEVLFRLAWRRITPEFYYRWLWKSSPEWRGESEFKGDFMNQLYQAAM